MTWISVKDKLPETGTDVLVWLPTDGWCELAFYTFAGEWFAGEAGLCNPSHWMPLPDRPEEGIQ